MKTVYIKLDNVEKVKSFVDAITSCSGDFELVSGRYIINAKSIMGIFSIDLSQPLQLNIHDPNEEKMEKLKPFIVK